jgi:hypothetical protein
MGLGTNFIYYGHSLGDHSWDKMIYKFTSLCSESCLSEFLSMGQIGSDGTDQIADFKKYFPFLFFY